MTTIDHPFGGTYSDLRGVTRCSTSGKRAFVSTNAAKRFRTNARQKYANYTAVRSYLCPDCGLYHNTSLSNWKDSNADTALD